MAASKELLTEILDGIFVVQAFLQQDLKQAALSPSLQARREIASETIENIVSKVRHAHPSIRPRVNTPSTAGKKPPQAPPPVETLAPTPEEVEEELYDEAGASEAPQQQAPDAEDYLSFEPAHLASNGVEGEEEPQEMYEAMENQELYEEPGNSTGAQGSQEAEAVENYEDPILSRPSTASLASQSQENSGSGAEYAETGVIHRPAGAMESTVEMSMDWSNVYNMPDKAEKMKVSTLKNVAIKGYLDKLGGRNHKTWQRRYCVLAGALLYFYEKESSKTYNNYIALLSFTASAAQNMTSEKKGQFAFKLTHTDTNTGKNKDYCFRAASQDVHDKWLSCISKVNSPISPTMPSPTPSSKRNSSSTLPRMPSRTSISTFQPDEDSRKRTQSLGEGEPQELYEDMAIPEEREDLDEYVAVSPTENIELESSEEYVDVVPHGDMPQEDYEDTTNFQQPPPPLSPPPGPPSDVFILPPPPAQPAQVAPPKAPAPPAVEVDTARIYDQPVTNGIRLEKVFVSLWDFAAGDSDELGLHRGDLVYVSSPLDNEEWWYGEVLDPHAARKVGPAGFFPKSYSTVAFETLAS